MICPHLIGDRCQLIDSDAPPPCRACQPQWIDGQPPAADRPTGAIRYANGAQRIVAATTAARAKIPRPPPKPRRRPPECDHSGRILRPGVRCGDRVYECDIHDEATCAKCRDCVDFVPVDNLTLSTT